MTRFLLIVLLLSAICNYANAQADSASGRQELSINSMTDHSFKVLQDKYSSLQELVERRTEKMLRHMQQRESSLREAMVQKDSMKAQQLFASTQQKYQQLEEKLKAPVSGRVEDVYQSYVPNIDSMQTALRFLSSKVPGLPTSQLQKMAILSSQLQQLQTSFASAGQAEEYIKQREQVLKDQLLNYGLGKQLLGINKEAVYFQQEMHRYRDVLNDKQKLETTILNTARGLPAFQPFWQKYSMLAQLFPLPDNYGTESALSGLQTNAAVTRAVQQSLGPGILSSNPSAGSAIPEQYIQQAQQQMEQLKDKALQAGVTSSNMTVPDFKPDEQHGKNFLKRLSFECNIQSGPATNFLPSILDIGFSVAVKISDNIRAGVGVSYKLGMGTIRCIHFSNEGIGLRSFLDIRAKNNLWITGGWEYNYFESFGSLAELHKNVHVWQGSALVGLTRRYKVGKKEGSVQLLYDFMAGHQVPSASPLKFRVGYTL